MTPVETLVDAARRGDQAALDRLLRDCMPAIYNLAVRGVGAADADDVVQETMIRAVRALPRLREPEKFRSWMVAIAVRETRRRGQRISAHRRHLVPLDDDVIAAAGAAPDDDAVSRIELARQRRELAAAVRWLDPDDRELLSLWWLTEAGAMERAELAYALRISAGTARVRLHRLRSRLATARLIVAALANPAGCEPLREVTAGWDGEPSPVWRKRLAKHVQACAVCGASGTDRLAPERLLAALPLLVAPRKTVAAMVRRSWRPAAAVAAALVVLVVIVLAVVVNRPAEPVARAPRLPPSSATEPPPVTTSSKPVQVKAGPVAGAGVGGPTWSATGTPPTKRHYLYVSGTGNDHADGRTHATALRTLAKAAGLTEPGDTVLVDNGDYTAPGRSSVLPIERSGTPDKWITWAAYPGSRPVVHATSWQGIHVHAAYVIVAGFTVVGASDRLTAAQLAAARAGDVSDPEISSNCIAADEQKTADPPHRPHHVVIWGNTVTDCPLGGISAMLADYVTVAYNVVARNGFYSPYGGSGISFLAAWNSDDSTATKMIIRGNRVYGNANRVPCLCSGSARRITDGNGIIVDSFSNESFRGAPMYQQPYRGRTLIEDNVAYGNGGRGVNVFASAHVDVVNDTSYRNAAQAGIASDVAVTDAQDVRVVNTIVVARAGKKSLTVSRSSAVRVDHVLLSGPSEAPAGAVVLHGDPLFVAAGNADFHLTPGSPAVDRGTADPAAGIDADRRARRGPADLGAFELNGT